MEPHDIAPAIQPQDVASSIGAYTVQCARCMKWRFIPTKEQYEMIRHSILKKPFYCSKSAIWRPNASCSDPLDISPDIHELWAVDRPGIPLPPDGWERLIVIRPLGSCKFADIYYVTPSGRKLRSLPEVVRYLEKHPEFVHAGLKLSQFSFVMPKPLERDHRKRRDETLAGDAKGSVHEKKSHLNNGSVESAPRKRAAVEIPLNGPEAKPKVEKLKCRKKAVTGVLLNGESQGFHGQAQSF